jgi:hypothetical protein
VAMDEMTYANRVAPVGDIVQVDRRRWWCRVPLSVVCRTDGRPVAVRVGPKRMVVGTAPLEVACHERGCRS